MAIAPVLKTGVRKDLGVRIPRPPLSPAPSAHSRCGARRRLGSCLPIVMPALVGLLFSPRPAHAHPGAGIVADPRGNVYFVVFGSSHLMKLTADGRATVFVSDDRIRVPHHLSIGPDGSLYVASDDDGRVWRVEPDGRIALHLDSRRQLERPRLSVGAGGDPFAVDAAGAVYALAEPNGTALIRIAAGSHDPLPPFTRLDRMHYRAMTVGPDGALYLTDSDRVWRVLPDSARTISPRGVGLLQPMGVAVDRSGNILVADYAARSVLRFTADGIVNTPPRLASMRFRGPSGVTSVGDTVYVLDNSAGSMAVWRITSDGARRVYTQSFWGWHQRTVLLALPAALVALLVVSRLRRRRSARATASGCQPRSGCARASALAFIARLDLVIRERWPRG